uniref:Uncharacterized protein n=1 Tax=Nelumbo nucifera TaxID=4432 RepID=A0A822YF27_NELNU|nr:TPA_asm: hypothetical protein HUJ06_011625 [Nelumbo nucifera]
MVHFVFCVLQGASLLGFKRFWKEDIIPPEMERGDMGGERGKLEWKEENGGKEEKMVERNRGGRFGRKYG